jgi:hypothetical protein
MNGINNNGIGYVFGQKTSSKNKYTSVTPQKNIYQSTNSPVRPSEKYTPVKKETPYDIRNYQSTKPENVNSYSVPATRPSNDLRNTQPVSSPTKVEYSSPSRNTTTEPKVNTYTPSERNYTKPERVNTYTQPQRQEPTRQPQRQEPTRQPQRQEPTRQPQRQNNPVKSNYSTPSRIETPRRQEPSRNISPNMQRSGQRISNGAKSGR